MKALDRVIPISRNEAKSLLIALRYLKVADEEAYKDVENVDKIADALLCFVLGKEI